MLHTSLGRATSLKFVSENFEASFLKLSTLVVSVGKIRKQWLKKTVGDIGLRTLKAMKAYIDPQNIFANNNLMMGDHSKL